MSASTFTITRPDGLKVRTTTKYTYYVTIPNGTRAQVIKRTDNISAAYRESLKWNGAMVFNRLRGQFVDPADLYRGHTAILARARNDRRQRSMGYNVRW